MANCDFYAVREDLEDVLQFVFEKGWSLYELSSQPERKAREFRDLSALTEAFELGQGKAQAHLLIYSPEMGGRVRQRKILFDTRRVKGAAFRYDVEGWGLIQLYLGGLHNGQVTHSHTNCNSEKRARSWEATYPELGRVSGWRWPNVNKMSQALNRRIRKLGVAKQGSRPVLPGAWRMVQEGKATCLP